MIENIRKNLEAARASVARGDAVAALAAIDAALDLSRPERTLSIREAADLLGGGSISTIKRRCRTGALRCATVAGRWVVPVSEIDRHREELAAEIGSDRPLSQEELDTLSSSRPGRPPWQRQASPSAEVA